MPSRISCAQSGSKCRFRNFLSNMILYHVTPTRNIVSILDEGIDPEYSKGARKVSWFVTELMLMWAIAHVSSRHSVGAHMISVCVCEQIEVDLQRTRWRGVFTSLDVIKPVSVFSAYEATQKHLEYAQVEKQSYAEPSDN